ncbi:adhesion G-protein coupled receptor G5-like [Brachyhypopomus gauderio]|uniref:adhesion G-protein coupled receptor G5-like n=1 Tax=Brachyhypopomus gauderio TaxID=698409 RepID=UPI00404336E5
MKFTIMILMTLVLPMEGHCCNGNGNNQAKCHMQKASHALNCNQDRPAATIKNLETELENTIICNQVPLKEDNLTAFLYNAHNHVGNLTIYANDVMASSNTSSVVNTSVQVFLPVELMAKANSTVVFCLISLSTDHKVWNGSANDGHLIGVSVSNITVSILKSPVIISVRSSLSEMQKRNFVPKCTFLNYSTSVFEDSGCSTIWKAGEDWVNCSCDHLTYFAVLMTSPNSVSSKDTKILSYITLVGCSLSLFFLLVTILLYFIKWRVLADQSQKVHISLAVALILLNVNFLLNDVAVLVPAICTYTAVLLHYSVMATFTWMAIEGFHLYLLLVRVFNIYIRRYLLKLSLVGWGFPAIVVTVILLTDKMLYMTPSPAENSTSNLICYISSGVVHNVTILGFFCLVFIFNMVMFLVVVWNVCFQQPVNQDKNLRHKAKDTVLVLGISCLLGISWGVIFFSMGQVPTPGLYVFCILNPLQGFSLFIWFCISKSRRSKDKHSVDTQPSST